MTEARFQEPTDEPQTTTPDTGQDQESQHDSRTEGEATDESGSAGPRDTSSY